LAQVHPTGGSKAFFDGLGAGFFPPAVVEQVRARADK